MHELAWHLKPVLRYMFAECLQAGFLLKSGKSTYDPRLTVDMGLEDHVQP